jgi:hypothetical protein
MTSQKSIIFDASTLISISMNGLIDELRNLKKIFDGYFIITNSVKEEVIDNPLKINKFKLEALVTNSLIEDKILELPSVFGISDKDVVKKSEELLNNANSAFEQGDRTIHILDKGETSCVALSKILTEKGIKNLVAVDERTMRILCEKPENLKKLLEKKLHTRIELNKEKTKMFQGIKIVRSSELIYFANKKDLTRLKGKKALEAFLYALKSKGCSVSYEEIDEVIK